MKHRNLFLLAKDVVTLNYFQSTNRLIAFGIFSSHVQSILIRKMECNNDVENLLEGI